MLKLLLFSQSTAGTGRRKTLLKHGAGKRATLKLFPYYSFKKLGSVAWIWLGESETATVSVICFIKFRLYLCLFAFLLLLGSVSICALFHKVWSLFACACFPLPLDCVCSVLCFIESGLYGPEFLPQLSGAIFVLLSRAWECGGTWLAHCLEEWLRLSCGLCESIPTYKLTLCLILALLSYNTDAEYDSLGSSPVQPTLVALFIAFGCLCLKCHWVTNQHVKWQTACQSFKTICIE